MDPQSLSSTSSPELHPGGVLAVAIASHWVLKGDSWVKSTTLGPNASNIKGVRSICCFLESSKLLLLPLLHTDTHKHPQTSQSEDLLSFLLQGQFLHSFSMLICQQNQLFSQKKFWNNSCRQLRGLAVIILDMNLHDIALGFIPLSFYPSEDAVGQLRPFWRSATASPFMAL